MLLMRLLSLFIFVFSTSILAAQVPALYSMHTQWDDKLTQWSILTVDEEIEGEMNMVWESLNRIDEWEFSFEGIHGYIKLKPLGNKEQWELRIGNNIVSIRQQWPGDLSEWRITDNTLTIDYFSSRRKDPYFWELKQEERFGKFQVYSEYTADPRDWVIIDELNEDFNFAMKMAMLFTPIIPLLPRR